MGKASRWFRGLLGLKKSNPLSPPALNSDPKQQSPKRKWSFVKSSREPTKNHHIHSKSAGERIRSRGGAPPPPRSPVEERHDPSKRTIPMAKAAYTVPAANDTAAVVRLTSGGRSASNDTVNTVVVDVNNSGFRNREECAAIKLQSHLRAYLSRRALRALKALVKLQALVRGHIVRKQYVERLRRMQAILRAQKRAPALRAQIYESSHATIKSTHFHHPGPATPEKSEHSICKSTKHEESFIFKRNGSISNGGVVTDKESVRFHYSMDEGSWEKRVYSTISGLANDKKSDKNLEIDIGKPHITPKRRIHLQSSLYPSASDPKSNRFTTSKETTIYQIIPSPSSYEVQSLSPKNYMDDVEETSFCTAQNSPQFYSASSKGGSSTRAPFTPIRSDTSRSCLSGYSYYPSYMSYTESSRAKVRSLSAPKQRHQLEKSSTTKRFSVHGGYGEQKVSSALHANFTNKAYPGSGRLDRLGMPIGADGVGFSGDLWYKY